MKLERSRRNVYISNNYNRKNLIKIDFSQHYHKTHTILNHYVSQRRIAVSVVANFSVKSNVAFEKQEFNLQKYFILSSIGTIKLIVEKTNILVIITIF